MDQRIEARAPANEALTLFDPQLGFGTERPH